jgi:hypothetical protein
MTKNIRRACVMLPAVILSLTTVAAFAQVASAKKPYNEWTMEEVVKFLSNSPWAQTGSKGIDPEVSVAVLPLGTPLDPEEVVIRLRSALPIRQALARLRQINLKYDTKNEAGKASINEKNKTLLDCPACADSYIVTMSNTPGHSKGVPTILRQMSQAELKLNVYLTDERGAKRELVHFEPQTSPAGEAVFFFARFDEKGEPLLTPSSKKLIIVFGPKIFGGRSITITKFEFDVSKMIVDGQVAF